MVDEERKTAILSRIDAMHEQVEALRREVEDLQTSHEELEERLDAHDGVLTKLADEAAAVRVDVSAMRSTVDAQSLVLARLAGGVRGGVVAAAGVPSGVVVVVTVLVEVARAMGWLGGAR